MAEPAPATAVARVAFVAPNCAMVLNDYNALATAVRKNGDQVRCFAPDVTREDAVKLDEQGIHSTQFSVPPDGFSLFGRRRAISKLSGLLSEWKPSVVIAIGGAELVQALQATRKLKRTRAVAIIESLLMLEAEGSAALARRPTVREFSRALRSADVVVCLNGATPEILAQQCLVGESTQVCVVPRCGVDLHDVEEIALPGLDRGPVFHLAGAFENEAGILAYCEAAAMVKEDAPDSKFVLSGNAGELANSFKGVVECTGSRLPSRDDLAGCHVFVSLRRQQALPFAAMNAVAMGRPLIAADTYANRELVDVRVNGCLVDPDDVAAISESMASFVRRPDLIAAMGRASRQKAVRRLDQTDAIAKLLPLLQLTQ